MEETYNKIKIFIVTALGSVTSFLGILAVPIYILVFSNVIDYVTAIGASSNRGENKSSNKSFKGIKKKVSMWLLVVVGVLIDQLVLYTSNMVGINLPFNYLVACIVAMWLCVNELISILENLKDILGDDMPTFLLPLVKNIRSQVEDKINGV